MENLTILVDSENVRLSLAKKSPPNWPFLKEWMARLNGYRSVHILYYVNARIPDYSPDIIAAKKACRIKKVKPNGRYHPQLLDDRIIAVIDSLPPDTDVALMSHDGDFAEALKRAHERNPNRTIYVVCQPEAVSQKLERLPFTRIINWRRIKRKRKRGDSFV